MRLDVRCRDPEACNPPLPWLLTTGEDAWLPRKRVVLLDDISNRDMDRSGLGLGVSRGHPTRVTGRRGGEGPRRPLGRASKVVYHRVRLWANRN